MCDSMPLLDEELLGEEFAQHFSAQLEYSNYSPSITSHNSENNKIEILPEPGLQLSKRIAKADELIQQIHHLEAEKNEFQRKLKDILKSVNEVTSLYEHEKKLRLDFQEQFNELTLKYEALNTEAVNKKLQFDQIEAQLEDCKGPIEYRELIVRHLKLCQKIDKDNPLHWHEKSLVDDLTTYCIRHNIKIPQLVSRSPRKRKAAILSKEIEIQCDLLPKAAEKPNLIDQSIQTEKLEMQNKACQHKVSTTTRGTGTADLIKRQSTGTSYKLSDTDINVHELLKELNWIADISPISPITDVESPVNSTQMSTNSSSPPQPLPTVELKTASTCTNICNVQRQVDYILPHTIKTSNSRPPSSLKFTEVKNETNIRSSITSPLITMNSNFNVPLNNFSNTFDELWNIFGQMLCGYLYHRSGNEASISSVPISTNKQDFYNWFYSVFSDLHAHGLINQDNVGANGMQENILDPLIHQSQLLRPQLFSNSAPIYTEKNSSFDEDSYLVKPKAQRNDSQEQGAETYKPKIKHTKSTERHSVATSPIRFITASPISSEKGPLNEISVPTHGIPMAGPSDLYSHDSQTPSAFASLNGAANTINKDLKSSKLKDVAEKILDLFPKVDNRTAMLKSIKKLIKNKRQKTKESNQKHQNNDKNLDLPNETAVDFIARLKEFESSHMPAVVNGSMENITKMIEVPLESHANSEEVQSAPVEQQNCAINRRRDSTPSRENSVSSVDQNASKTSTEVHKDFRIRLQSDVSLPKTNDDRIGVEVLGHVTKTGNQLKCKDNSHYKHTTSSSPINTASSEQLESKDDEIVISLSKPSKEKEELLKEPELNVTLETKNFAEMNSPTPTTTSFVLDTKEIQIDKQLPFLQTVEEEIPCEGAFASISSDESALIITSDTEDMLEIAEIKPPPKRRGRKRKSETILQVPEESLTTPCKRSARLLAKQNPRKPHTAHDKEVSTLNFDDYIKRTIDLETSANDKEKPESIATTYEKPLSESSSVDSCEDLTTFIPISTTPPRNDMIDLNHEISMEIPLSPASPIPPDNDVTTILPPRIVCAVETHQKLNGKTLIRCLIDNYDVDCAVKPKNTQQQGAETVQRKILQTAFTEYFTSPEEDEAQFWIADAKLQSFCVNLLQVTQDTKLIADALIACMQNAPRTPRTPYLPYTNDNMPSYSLEMNVRCSTSWHVRVPHILNHLYRMDAELVTVLLTTIEAVLFTSQKTKVSSLDAALNLTDFYLLILLNNYIPMPTNPARLFIAKCYFFHTTYAAPMIYAVLSTFPTVLPHREERDYDRSDALITVLQHLLMCTPYDMNNHECLHRELLSKLRFEYHYPKFKPDFEEVLTNLIEKLRVGKLNDLSYAFAIFCKRQRHDRVTNDVLNTYLIPLSQEYYNLLQQTTDYDARAAALLDCFSYIVKSFSKHPNYGVGKNAISEYLDIFKRFLFVVERPLIQEAAVHAILRLQHFCYNECFFALLNFKPKYKLQLQTRAALKTFIHRRPQKYLKSLLYENKQLENM